MTVRIGKPSPGLERDQDFVFREMSDLVRNSARADRAYDGIAETKNGLLISADIARQLAPEFRSWSGRVRHTSSTSSPAGAYAHDRILRELARPRERKRLLITAGGPGSGKTTALKGNAMSTVDLVFDNQFKDVPRAREILDSALGHGWEIEVMYVHRNFVQIPRAVMERSQRTGRWNLLSDLPKMHLDARLAVWRLNLEYSPKGVVFHASVNSAQDSAEVIPKKPMNSSALANEVTENRLMPMKTFYLGALAKEATQRYDDFNHGWKTYCKKQLEEGVSKGRICKELAQIVGGEA